MTPNTQQTGALIVSSSTGGANPAAAHEELAGPNAAIAIKFSIDPMISSDLPVVRAMMEATPGVSMKEWESTALMERALSRNIGLNWVARAADGAILGASFAGDTGFRVSFHHVTVREGFRQQGIGSALVDETIEVLKRLGVLRVINIVENDNEGAIAFWGKKGFRVSTARGGVTVQMTRDLEPVEQRVGRA
jgi:ribosomal protein S18 acetylase RimI-like enzyme